MIDLTKRILDGDIRAASRLMRDIDDQIPSSLEALKELYPKTGKAYIIGITGSSRLWEIDDCRQDGRLLP